MAEVMLRIRRWAGDREASADEESTAMLLEDLVVDGASVLDATHRETNRAGLPPVRLDVDGFLTVGIDDCPPSIRGRYGASEYLSSTSGDFLALPVSSLTVEVLEPRDPEGEA